MCLCVPSVSAFRDLPAEEAGDSESEWEPDPDVASQSGPAEDFAHALLVWESNIGIPNRVGIPEESGPAGPVPQQDPKCPFGGVGAANH